jgi:hypothetical protein
MTRMTRYARRFAPYILAVATFTATTAFNFTKITYN